MSLFCTFFVPRVFSSHDDSNKCQQTLRWYSLHWSSWEPSFQSHRNHHLNSSHNPNLLLSLQHHLVWKIWLWPEKDFHQPNCFFYLLENFALFWIDSSGWLDFIFSPTFTWMVLLFPFNFKECNCYPGYFSSWRYGDNKIHIHILVEKSARIQGWILGALLEHLDHHFKVWYFS